MRGEAFTLRVIYEVRASIPGPNSTPSCVFDCICSPLGISINCKQRNNTERKPPMMHFLQHTHRHLDRTLLAGTPYDTDDQREFLFWGRMQKGKTRSHRDQI